MPTSVTKEELLRMAGHESGPTQWLAIDQERVNLFADATGDHQFIHVDPEKAARLPFGTTIAHGYLTLSLLPMLSEEIAVQPEGLVMAFNYGVNKVRFPNPVPVGSKVRARRVLEEVDQIRPNILQLKQKIDRERRLRKKNKGRDERADAGGPAAAA